MLLVVGRVVMAKVEVVDKRKVVLVVVVDVVVDKIVELLLVVGNIVEVVDTAGQAGAMVLPAITVVPPLKLTSPKKETCTVLGSAGLAR